MEEVNKDITYSDIKNYWITLFPELDSMDELDNILKEVSNINREDIEKFILNYPNKIKIDIDDLFKKESSIILDEISNDIKKEVVFYNFFKPLFNFFIDDCYKKIELLDIVEDPKAFILFFIKNECISLLEFAQRTLVLEVNIARLNGSLKGITREDRFNYYIDILLSNENYVKSVYMEYSHMYNILIARCKWNFEFMLEVLTLTKKHIGKIKSHILNSNEDVKVKTISSSLGDSHKKGRTVSKIDFTNKSSVIFKPRSLELEYGFNKFINYLNKKANNPKENLYEIKIVSGENYGFCEFIKHTECTDEAEVKQFYYRTGKLLGALFALNAKDIHHENIIAMGNQPVVIDLEALFHSEVTLLDKRFFKSIEVAQKIIDSSVYSIGFLPQKISSPYSNDSEAYVDISAFGGEENQAAPFKAFSVVNANTDEIKIEKVEGYIESQNNNPKVNGKIKKSEDYIYDIKQGFSHVYDILYTNKDEVTSNIKSIFKGMKNRFILRPTYIYGQLMNTSYHPDFMREEIHRYVLLHRLGVNVEKDFFKVIFSEIQDILQGDVPYFYSYIDSNELKNSEDEKVDIILDKSPLDKVLMKIYDLSYEDKTRQMHFIDMSFLAKTTNSNKDNTNTVFSKNINEEKRNNKEFIDLAIQIGDYLIDKSIVGYSDNRLDRTWISTILIGRDECNWCLSPVGNSLYDGNSGIALFLAYLGKLTGEKRFINVAREAIEGVIHEIEVLDTKYPFLIGPYNGISGYFYSIYQIYKITDDDRFLNIIKEKIYLIYQLIPKDKNIDVIGGVSGAIGVLLSIYNDCKDAEFKHKIIDLCKLCFKHIKEAKKDFFEDSIAWGNGGVYIPCTGFAHGNAGIIAYLIKLYKVIGDDEILDVIEKALNYERHLYVDEYKNWYSSNENKKFSLAWCHGAPGILLSRLILKESGYKDAYIDSEIKNALETTMKHGFGNNPCFCHGDLGNVSIVQYAAEVLNDKELKNRCTNTFNFIFKNVIKERWNKGVFSGTESMGLMIGLSSFGYGLLKEINKQIVPEILWF